MTREEIVSVRQRLLERRFQPISVYNWDHADIPKKERGKRPSEPGWQKRSECRSTATTQRTPEF